MQRKWYMSVVQISTVRAVVLALMSSLLTAVVAVTTTVPAQAIGAQGVMLDTSVYHHSCAIASNGEVWCWGYNNDFPAPLQAGMLGAGVTTESSTVPVKAHLPNGVIARELTTGYGSACIISTTGQLYCWGDYTFGDGPLNTSETPTLQPVPNNAKVIDVALGGGNHVCLLLETNTVCGGRNAFGQLGTADTSTAYRRVPLPAETVDLDAEGFFSCAVISTGQVYCWGRNDYGQLGNPALTDTMTSTPQLVSLPAGANATSISLSFSSACAVLTTGAAYCWGNNAAGQLGIGSTTDSRTPAIVQMPSGESVTSVHTGREHVCAITASEQFYCWGRNSNGQLGLNDYSSRNVPTLVSVPLNAGENFVEVGVGAGETCVMTTSRTLCAGHNHKGQLGNGTTTNSSTFQEVSGFTEPSRRCADVTSATGQNFTGADLSYCDFTKVPGASFAGDTLANANLSYANLSNLSFGGANVSGANFDSATAIGASFAGSTFDSSTSMANTNLQSAQIARGVGITGIPSVMPLYRTLQGGVFRSTDARLFGNPALYPGSDTQTPIAISPQGAGWVSTVENSMDSVTVFAAGRDPFLQTISVNGNAVSHNTWTLVPLVVDTNQIHIVVTAEDGISQETTTITVTRERTRCLRIPVRYIDLRDCDLRLRTDLAGADFRNALLQRVDLRGVNLTGANFTGATLTMAAMESATLINANFTSAFLDIAGMGFVRAGGANFTNANLSTAFLGSARLETATLTNATLTDAVLTGTRLDTATLTGVRSGGLSVSPVLPTGWTVVTNTAGLKYLVGPGADLSGTDLSGTNLSNLDLTGVTLTNADIRGANLSGAVMETVTAGGLRFTPGAGPVVSSRKYFDDESFVNIVNGYLRSGALATLAVDAEPAVAASFDPETRDYYVNVPHSTSTVRITITPVDSSTSLMFNGQAETWTATAPYAKAFDLPLFVGNTSSHIRTTVVGTTESLVNSWWVHVTRAAAPAPSSGSGGGGGGGALAPAPTVTPETSTATPKVETSTVTPKADTATATGGSATGGSTSTGTGSVNETPTVTAPLVTTEVRRLVFRYSPRQTVLNRSQLQRLRLQLTATTTAVSVLGYVTRSKSTSADRAKSLQRANRAASQIVRTASMPKPTTRGAGGAKAKGCEQAKNDCVVVLITRTK